LIRKNRSSGRSKFAISTRIYVAISFAFIPALWPVLSASGSATPQQNLSAQQQDLSTYQSTLNDVTTYYQTYTPDDLPELDAATAAVSSFSSAVSSLSLAVSTYDSTGSVADTAELAVNAQPFVISAALSSRDTAQTTFDDAVVIYDGFYSDYLQAELDRDTAYSEYQAALDSDASTGDFTNSDAAYQTFLVAQALVDSLDADVILANDAKNTAGSNLVDATTSYDYESNPDTTTNLETVRDQAVITFNQASTDFNISLNATTQANADALYELPNRTIAEPQNLAVTQDTTSGDVTLSWDRSATGWTPVERYAVFFNNWAVAAIGDVETFTLSRSLFESTGGLDILYTFKIRGDNDSFAVYSPQSVTADFIVAGPAPTPTQEPTPTPTPTLTPTLTPTPTQPPTQLQPPTQTADPIPTLTPTPTPTPTPTNTQEPVKKNDPIPDSNPVEPTTTPKRTPPPTPTPTPTSTPTPTKTEQTPQSTPAPTSKPIATLDTVPPIFNTPTATPTPTATRVANPEPKKEPVIVELEEPITAENIEALVREIAQVENPRILTNEQQTSVKEAAFQAFQTAPQGSIVYEAALEALSIVAEADDPEMPKELAAIPLVGAATAAVLEVFNDIGNLGADMSPEVREESEEVVVAAVIVSTVAQTAATAAATSSASASSSVTSSRSRTVKRSK